jgi:putative transposase
MSKKSNQFSPEVRERAVRMVLEHRGQYPSLWAAIESIAPKIGCVPQTLNEWVKRHQIDTGARDGITHFRAAAPEGARAREQRAAPRQRNIEVGQRVFRPGGARPPLEVLRKFVDQHRLTFGVEPICKMLQIAPSGYWRHASHQRNPQLRCARVQRDDTLIPEIDRVWQSNRRVYGADKVWKQMNREGFCVARCTVERLMKRWDCREYVVARSFAPPSAT